MANGVDKPVTNFRVIIIVVLTLCVIAMVTVTTLSFVLVSEKKPDQNLLTAFVGLTTGVLGVIGGMLTKTAPSEATRTVSLTDQPSIIPAEPEPPPAP